MLRKLLIGLTEYWDFSTNFSLEFGALVERDQESSIYKKWTAMLSQYVVELVESNDLVLRVLQCCKQVYFLNELFLFTVH